MARKTIPKKPLVKATAAVEVTLSPPLVILKSLGVLVLVVLINYASMVALHPIYGSVPSQLQFVKASMGAFLVSNMVPSLPEHIVLLTIGALTSIAPTTAFYLGSYTARQGDALLGPVYTQLAISIPVMILTSTLLRSWALPLIPREIPAVISRMGLAWVSWTAVQLLSAFPDVFMPRTQLTSSCSLLVTLGMVFTMIGGLSYQNKLQKATSNTQRPSLISTVLSFALFGASMTGGYYARTHSPCTPPPLPALMGNSTRLLASSDSVTGRVIVGENLKDGFRFLRVDHSLLGGRWVNERVTDPSGLGDSIYSAFTVQEAVRLAARPNKAKAEGPEKVLNIGLGVGTSTQAFQKHGLHTTVVEIDPVVYNYTRTFFDLAAPDVVFLEDARGWVKHKANEVKALEESSRLNEQFDYVVHDCFSGGGVPSHLFTMEFWADLKEVIKPDGVVGVNFAGHLGSHASRAILLTLQKSFSQCRTFHDRFLGAEDPEDTFINMVFFCSSAPEPLAFRQSVVADYLESPLREHILSTLSQREIDPSIVIGNEIPLTEENEGMWILSRTSNLLGKWQYETAVEHWSVMRNIMPDTVWESY